MKKVKGLKNRLRKSLALKWVRSEKAKKVALSGLAVVLALVVLVQIFYPSDRALPFTKLSGSPVGGVTRQEIGELADELYDKSTIEVKGHNEVMIARTASSVGVEMNREALVDQAVNYPWWLRVVPFSSLLAGSDIDEFVASINETDLAEFIEADKSSFVISPQNAQLIVEDSEARVVGGAQGARLTPDQFERGVKGATYRLGGPTVLAVEFTYTDPAIRQSDLAELRQWASDVLERELSLVFEDTTAAIDRPTIADWLIIDQEDVDSVEDISLSLSSEKVVQFAKEHFDKIIVQPAGVTEVNLIDGIEQSRRPGAVGRAVNGAGVVRELEVALLGEDSTVEAVTVPVQAVAPSLKNNHTFTKTQRGLQAYVNSLAEEGKIRVSVAQIGGNGWRASYLGGEQTVAASTYKIYVVAYALNEISKGKLSYDDKINDMSLRQCIERTIVQSDNDCPEAMMDKFGRTNLNNFLYARGYSRATTFTNTTASQTTTNDLTKAMIEIDNGRLVRGAERSFMLDLMGRSVHRQGIVAGSSAPVQNKVGFLWNYLNDAAIVNHPRGKYAISIMTEGKSWAKIAEITRKIEGIMY